MASAFTHVASAPFTAGKAQILRSKGSLAIPDLLSCLVLSWSEHRAELLQSVAEDEAWHAKVCEDVQEFLQSIFQLDVPLAIVDLPPTGTASYDALREMAAHACGLHRSLMVVCGTSEELTEEIDLTEELWARQLGVWAYLPEADSVSGLRLVFAEARKALAQKSSAHAETSGFL